MFHNSSKKIYFAAAQFLSHQVCASRPEKMPIQVLPLLARYFVPSGESSALHGMPGDPGVQEHGGQKDHHPDSGHELAAIASLPTSSGSLLIPSP